jgi:putative SOS response-associated peptidase YedK
VAGGSNHGRTRPDGDPLFAGLWENWRDRNAGDGAEWIRTCTIITGEPNELVAPIHNRMPMILPREAWATWLGEEPADEAALRGLLKPFPTERMRAYPISTRVNSVKNDDAALIEPVMAPGGVSV